MLDESAQNNLNQAVTAVTATYVSKLQAAQSAVGLGTPRTKARYGKKEGLINKVSLSFSRAAVFREKGAGRGQGGQKGSRWKNAKGESIKTNPKSLGKMNSGNRTEKPLVNPIIDDFVDDLTSAVASEFVTLSFKNIRIK